MDAASADQLTRFAEIVASMSTFNDPAFIGPVIRVEFQNCEQLPPRARFAEDPGPADWFVLTETIDEADEIERVHVSVIDMDGTVRETVEL